MKPTGRRAFIGSFGGGIATLAGCLGRSDARGGPAADRAETTADTSATAPPTVDRSLPSAYTTDELVEATRSGGPAPDGIPAIERPRFADASDPPAILDDGDPVFGVDLGGERKAYPQSILVWHEIVNDVVGNEPVSVTYCPLTGTAQGFIRGDTTFGVSGQLVNTNLVMFDRETESWWPQVLSKAITGPPSGAHLEEFQVVWTTWERWRSAYPDTTVLVDDTGFARDYGSDPYGAYNPPEGYYADDSTLFPPLATDDALHPKAVVIGMRSANGAAAVRKGTLREQKVIELRVGGKPHVAVYDETLDTGYVYRIEGNGDGDGSGTSLDDPSITWADGRIEVDGDPYDPASLPFEREIAFDAMWLAWYGYYPMTELVR